METNTTTTAPFEFKGGLFPLTALQITDANLSNLEEALLKKINQAPNFFKNAPMVIDLQKIKQRAEELNFQELVNLLRKNSLCPIGIRGGNETLMQLALKVGLPTLPEDKAPILNTNTTTNSNSSNNNQNVARPLEALALHNKLITSPVRSGQQVFAPMGDIIIMNHVSQGAEILAHGNIHVYGSLRGRALAGIHGDTNSKIFCTRLEAELVSISGNYLVSEDLSASTHWNKSVACALVKDKLEVTDI